MHPFDEAQKTIDIVEEAIGLGDLEAASIAVEALRPLLVSDKIEEIQRLKERVDGLVLEVRHQRQSHQSNLKKLSYGNVATAAYRQMSQSGIAGYS